MKRIASIIDSCWECPHGKKYNSDNDTDDCALVCAKTNQRRLIYTGSSKVDLGIPNWCPLETYAEHSEHATANPKTVVFDCLPHLEWMTDNLTGHGGTEVDGRWYYTWEQAMAAAKELGDGWRLPTDEEFEMLANLGSTWVDNGPDGMPGRWFGGNHATDHEGSVFFPAAGYRDRSSGALANVGGYGLYWSSSPYSETSYYAGYLTFGGTRVIPLSSSLRAHGFSVRCAKDISER